MCEVRQLPLEVVAPGGLGLQGLGEKQQTSGYIDMQTEEGLRKLADAAGVSRTDFSVEEVPNPDYVDWDSVNSHYTLSGMSFKVKMSQSRVTNSK